MMTQMSPGHEESWCRGTWCSTSLPTMSYPRRRRCIRGTWHGSRSSATAGICCWSARSGTRRPRVRWRCSGPGRPRRRSSAMTRSSTRAWSRPGRCGSGTRSRARSEQVPFSAAMIRTRGRRGDGLKVALDSDMQGGPVNKLLDVAVERPALDHLQVEVGSTPEDRVHPGLTGDHGEECHLHAVDKAGAHQRPVHRQAAVRAQRHLGLLFEPGDDVDGVAAHKGRVWPVQGSFEGRRYHRCRQIPHPGIYQVTHLRLLGARVQHLHELPKGVGPEDHPLLLLVQGEAAVEKLGALLTPIATPVATVVRAEAVEAGKDVEGVRGGHVVLLGCG